MTVKIIFRRFQYNAFFLMSRNTVIIPAAYAQLPRYGMFFPRYTEARSRYSLRRTWRKKSASILRISAPLIPDMRNSR